MRKKKPTPQEKLMAALGCYATYKPFSFEEWKQWKEDLKDHKLLRYTNPQDLGLQRRVG